MVRRSELDDDVEPWRRGRRRRRRPRRQMPMWQEIPLLLVVAFCLAVLIRTFLLQAFFIPSGSMEDTLLVGDRVLVNKVVYDVRDPVRGEVVVFRGTDDWAPEQSTTPEHGFVGRLAATLGDLVGISRPGEKDFIKRVVGVGGDRVACCDKQGRVTVNGRALDEQYVSQNSPLDLPPNPDECRSRRFAEVVVPSGQLFVMGDHRLVSQDARCQGPVPVENVIGRAFVVVWPRSSWASLPVPPTFADVPAPATAAPATGPYRIESEPGGEAYPDGGSDPVGAGAVAALPVLAATPPAARARRPGGTRPRRLLS